MPDWTVEVLSKEHARDHFDCGHRSLDDFLKKYAGQYAKRKLGTTYVAVEGGSKRVLGYYTLAPSHFAFEEAPTTLLKGLPRHPVPSILLARLAVDQSTRGKGLGKFLLVNAFERCLRVAEQISFRAIEVEAIDDSAVSFYERYGFIAFSTNPRHMAIGMETIAQAMRN